MKRHFFLSTVAGVLLASFLTAPVEFYRSSPDVRDTTCCAYFTNPLVLGSSSWRQHKRRTERNGEKIISTTRDGVSVELRQDDDSLALIVVDSSTGAYVGTLRCQERAVGAIIDALQTYSDETRKE